MTTPTPLFWLLLCSATLSLTACDDLPVLRTEADSRITLASGSDDSSAAQCQQLRDQVRANQESSREAPVVSTSPQIVAAAQGKADVRIQDLRDRMDSLGCSDTTPNDPDRVRVAPLPAAPNAPNP